MPMTPKEELDAFNKKIKDTKDIEELKKLTSELASDVFAASESAERFKNSIGESVKLIGEGASLFNSIKKATTSAADAIANFATSTTQQYRLGEQLAKSYKQTSINIGIGYQNQELLSKEFNRSVVLVEQLGGNLDDVKGIYSKFSEQSGRVRILDEEEVQRIFAIERATGLLGDSATALAERFDLMGVGSKQFSENINQIVKDSQKIGLNSTKVVKVLSDNFESMQRMSFRGGVKAMTEMSKLAVKMRIDVSDMLGMADKFYEPEAAIEAAAQLQLMGGDIAEAFGDPFETMYLARNKPEELAKRLQGMTENMVAFNEETGEYELPAEARQQLSFAAEQLGLAKDSVIDMAFQSSKMKDIKLSVGGDFTEEQLDKISSIAKFKDGQWKVDVNGDSIAVDELNTTQLEEALITPSTEEDAIIETAKASMTTNQHLEALVQSTKTSIAAETRLYNAVEKLATPTIANMKGVLDEAVKTTSEAFKSSDMGSVLKQTFDLSEVAFKSASLNLTNAINGLTDKIKSQLEDLKEDTTTSTGTPDRANATLSMNYSNELDANTIKTQNKIVEKEEKVIKEKTESLNKNINQSSKMDVSGTITVNIPDITVNGKPLEGNSVTKRKIEKMVSEAVIGGTEKVLNIKQSGMDANTGG